MNIIVLSGLLLAMPLATAADANDGWPVTALPGHAYAAGTMGNVLAGDPATDEADRFSIALAARPLALPALPALEQVAADAPLFEDDAGSEILEAARGKEGGTANAVLGGIVTGNTALNVTSGANTITEGAFANMSGLPVVIQNSGANVLIQNATVINLQLR